jgi:hypothetical protein
LGGRSALHKGVVGPGKRREIVGTLALEVRRMSGEAMSRSITIEEAAEVADAVGIDFATVGFDLEQFTRGMRVELEHGRRDPETDVTHDDPIATGKIAWAHLRELPDYYDRLAEMEVRRHES